MTTKPEPTLDDLKWIMGRAISDKMFLDAFSVFEPIPTPNPCAFCGRHYTYPRWLYKHYLAKHRDRFSA